MIRIIPTGKAAPAALDTAIAALHNRDTILLPPTTSRRRLTAVTRLVRAARPDVFMFAVFAGPSDPISLANLRKPLL